MNKYMLHAVWVSGMQAGVKQVYELSSWQSAVQTMNVLLKYGVCAWIAEVQNANR